VTQRC